MNNCVNIFLLTILICSTLLFRIGSATSEAKGDGEKRVEDGELIEKDDDTVHGEVLFTSSSSESESDESKLDEEDNNYLGVGHNPPAKVIGEESAERILIKVLRQSGFQTEEEINEALSILRPPKKQKKKKPETEMERKQNEAKLRRRRRNKRNGKPKAVIIAPGTAHEMVLRMEPRPTNATSGQYKTDDTFILDILPIDAKPKQQKRNVENGEDDEAEEDWRKVNFTMIPDGDGPSMVPKPWWM